MIEWIQGELKQSPEILLFLSLAIGFGLENFNLANSSSAVLLAHC